MKPVDIIVAGAGVWGCSLARVLAEAGRQVLVLEKRPVVGGNVRCNFTESGIEVHQYGSHIFHTHRENVWRFIRRFIEFNGYQHKVLARYQGRTYFLPLGLTLVNQFYNLNLTPAELPNFIANEVKKSQGDNSLENGAGENFETQAISFIGRPLYNAFIREYTRKQWGMDPCKLSAAIIRRLPVRASYDVNYFSDYWQGIPQQGYNALFDALLDHPNISVECGVDWLEWRNTAAAKSFENVKVFYSGAIDALCAYSLGPLPWRSLRFESETLPIADYQGTSVMNYTGADVPFTRIHEFKHYHPENKQVMQYPSTVIMREYPKTWRIGDEPYYPVDTPESRELLARYQQTAAQLKNVFVGGRLGAYRYFDMDAAMGDALEVADNFLHS